jgi:aminoglycoside phosphotransferase (APT) family kinase protein
MPSDDENSAMPPQPWEADRALTLDGAAAIIAAAFPDIGTAGLRHLGSGWDFDAFLTRDDWVFRFPRRADCARQLRSESRVVRLVAEFLPSGTAVPQVELWGAPSPGFPYEFVGYRFIAGAPVDSAPVDVLPRTARDLGAILGALHSIPEPRARSEGVEARPADDFGAQEWARRGVEGVRKLRGLDPAVDRAMPWLETVTLPLSPWDGALQLIHQDLAPEHVLADPTTGAVTGILDWSDAILGDPARDFVFLVTWQGWPFAEQVIAAYPRHIDPGFRERVNLMARLLSLIWLSFAIEQGEDTSVAIRQVRNAFADP